MRISDVRLVARHFPFSPVEVATDEGIIGIGACVAGPTVIRPILDEGPGSLKQLLLGEDPLDSGRLWRKMFLQWGASGTLAINAMGAIDMALWDIAGKALGLPIYKLLGGAVQPQVMARTKEQAYGRTSRPKR